MGPIGAARVGFINDEYVLNPTLDEMAETQLDLVVAGTADAVLMVESEAKELTEDIMLGAVMFGHRHFQPVIDAIIELAEKAAKEPRDFKIVDESALEKEMLGLVEQDLRAAYAIPVKQDRYAAVGEAKEKVMAHYFPEGQEPKYDKLRIAGVFKELEAKIVRWNILDTGKRIDGRDSQDRPQIVAEVGVLPRAHGSALFTRGETQAWWSPRSAPARTSSTSTRCRERTRRRSCCTTTSLPTRSARPAAWAARAPRNRPRQAGLARDPPDAAAASRVPLHASAWSPRSPSRTARPRWRRSAAPRWR